jgi:hypothetical protein
MPRSGPRPHCWKVQGELNHQQYLAWLQMRAQANYRKEKFELTFEDFQSLWQGHWYQKGRGAEHYCLTRTNPDGTWCKDNVNCIPRVEHLRRQKLYKKERQHDQNYQIHP